MIHDGYNAACLSVTGGELAWIVGVSVGWILQALRELDRTSSESDSSPPPA